MRPSAKLTWLATILFPVVMLLLFANALLFDTQTYHALLQPGAYTTTVHVLDYFHGKVPVPTLFNTAERSHLADVKRVINTLEWLAPFLFLIWLAVLPFTELNTVLVRGFQILLLIVFLLVLIPFDTVFTHFHQVFFPQGNWMFPADSMLILLYPASFFQAFFTQILALTLVFSSVFAVFGRISLVQHNNP